MSVLTPQPVVLNELDERPGLTNDQGWENPSYSAD